MSSESLHVPREKLSRTARLMHYAITSMKEELDAVDWYRQRADDAEDEELKAILLHNMREEMEHACMLIEWLRRRNADFDGHLREYLFTDESIVGRESAATGTAGRGAERGDPGGGGAPPRRFTIGSLKPERQGGR